MFKSLIAAAGLAMIVVAPALAQVPPEPPISAYADLPALDQVALSPDGLKLAFIGSVPSGGRRMGVRTLAGETLGVVSLGDQKVRDVSWADDNHVVVTTSSYTDIAYLAGRSEFYTAQSFDIRDRSFVTLLSSSSSAGRPTSSVNRASSAGTGAYNFILGAPFQRVVDGQSRTFVRSVTRALEPAVFEVNLDTGQGTLRENFEGVVGPDGRSVARAEWDRDTGRWWVSAKDTVGWRQIWNRDGFMIDTPSLLGYGRTADSVLISVPEQDADVFYELPLDGSAARKLDLGDMLEPAPIYHPDDGRLLGFASVGSDLFDYVFFDQTLARGWASIIAAYPNDSVRLVSATPDYSKVVIMTSGPADAGTFSLVDMRAGSAVRVGSQYPNVPAAALGQVSFITYEAADGLEIPAYLTLPPGREAKDLPLIVLPHGGPQARDTPGFDHWTQLLASRGYAVLQPQYRGSTGFGTAHLEAGYGQWGRKMQSDLTDGVHALRDQGVIDPARVCIFGWSYGGYAAMAGATLDPETYRCIIAGAGVSDLPAMLAWERDQTGGRDTPVMRYWKRFMGADRINDGAIAEVSPTRLADRVRAPVLLIHGRDDSVVPYEQSELFRRALERANKPVEMVTLQGEDHWLSRASGRMAVSEALIAFLDRNNPAD